MTNPELESNDHELVVSLGDYILRLSIDRGATYIDSLPEGKWPSTFQSLAAVPAHNNAGAGLRRCRFDTGDMHCALHIVDKAAATDTGYCNIHVHDDAAELNVIVPSSKGLTYDVYDGIEWQEVSEPTALWFPPGTTHCATAKIGSGLFFVARIPVDAAAYYDATAPRSIMIDTDLIDPDSSLPAFEQQYGMNFFAYLQEHPKEWQTFNLKMEFGLKKILPPDSISKVPLPKSGVVVDVGGGLGYVAKTITDTTNLETIVCDLPYVCEQAKQKRNVDVFSGDTFTDELPKADTYLLVRTLHDLQESDAIKLLKNIRKFAPRHAGLRIIDSLIGEDESGYADKQQTSMSLLFRSEQHSIQSLQTILNKSGWKSSDITRLSTTLSCLSAVPI